MGDINICMNVAYRSTDFTPVKVCFLLHHKYVLVGSSTFLQHVVSRDARLCGVGAVPQES